MITDPTIRVERARQMLGLPYEHLGRGNGNADCIAVGAYAIGYPMDQIPHYPHNPVNGELERHLDAVFGGPLYVGNITMEMLQEGDLVAMQYRGPCRHLGVVANHPAHVGALSLIHTDSRLNKVTEHILDGLWLRRIKRVYR